MTKLPRPIHEVAIDIYNDWENVNYAAKPYLSAMMALTDMDSMYIAESAPSVVRYFLSNASTYRGETAKKLKAELRAMLNKHAYRRRASHDMDTDTPEGDT